MKLTQFWTGDLPPSLLNEVQQFAKEGPVNRFFEDENFKGLYSKAQSELHDLFEHALDNKYRGDVTGTLIARTQTFCETLKELFACIKLVAIASLIPAGLIFVWDVGLVAQLMFLFNIVFEVSWFFYHYVTDNSAGVLSTSVFLLYEMHKYYTKGEAAVWDHDSSDSALTLGPPLPYLPNHGSMVTPEPILVTVLAFTVFAFPSIAVGTCLALGERLGCIRRYGIFNRYDHSNGDLEA